MSGTPSPSPTPWLAGVAECRLCGHRRAVTYCGLDDPSRLECTACGCATAEIVERRGADGEELAA